MAKVPLVGSGVESSSIAARQSLAARCLSRPGKGEANGLST
jgi:hypothetical protein